MSEEQTPNPESPDDESPDSEASAPSEPTGDAGDANAPEAAAPPDAEAGVKPAGEAAEAPSNEEESAEAPASNAAEAIAQEALSAAQDALSSIEGEGANGSFEPPVFPASRLGDASEGIDLLSDVNVNVKIELGRTRMLVEDVLRLADGAVVELDKLAGDPVDVYVNDRHVARGEVLIMNDNFCVRVNEILAAPSDEKKQKEEV